MICIAGFAGRNFIQIQNAADIPPEFYNLQTIGITAGASTPDSIITAVEEALKIEKK